MVVCVRVSSLLKLCCAVCFGVGGGIRAEASDMCQGARGWGGCYEMGLSGVGWLKVLLAFSGSFLHRCLLLIGLGRGVLDGWKMLLLAVHVSRLLGLYGVKCGVRLFEGGMFGWPLCGN